MALPTSPPISLNQIKTEFGATGSRALTEFYRGGSFVPNTPANSSVPSSGSISLLDFLGASNYTAPTATATGASGEMQMGPPGDPFANVTTFSPAVCAASGGTGSFSYLWQRVSGDTAITIVGAGTSASAHFQTLALPRNSTRTATWRCRVTDGVTTVYSNNVTIRLDYWIVQ